MTPAAPTVLVVDDHALVRNGCRRLLEPPLGRFWVVEAASGAAALAALADHPEIGVVACDLNLPGEPAGLALIERLARSGPAVLVLSMHEATEVAARCVAAGAAGYLSKSDDPGDLAKAVEAVLADRNSAGGAQGERTCGECGGSQPAAWAYCSHCGAEMQ